MGKEEVISDLMKIAKEKRVEISDEMLDQVAGGYYSNWADLDRETQLKLQQESILNMARGNYCEIFNTESATEYHGKD